MRSNNFRTPLVLTQPTHPTAQTHGEVATGSDKWELSDKIGPYTIKRLGLWKGRWCLDWWYAKCSSQAVSSVPHSCYYSTTTTHQLQAMFFSLIHGSPNSDPPGCNMRPAATFESHVYSSIIPAAVPLIAIFPCAVRQLAASQGCGPLPWKDWNSAF